MWLYVVFFYVYEIDLLIMFVINWLVLLVFLIVVVMDWFCICYYLNIIMFFYDNRFELLLKFKERNENIILKLLKLYYDFYS